MTPAIPSWIRGFQLEKYRNIFEPSLVPQETRLYGTESLYGDWNGRVLLLAKDFACSSVIHDRKGKSDPRPYRHDPDLRTNKRLRAVADMLRTGENPEHCGLLYGSALACLLRDDNNMSGTLPQRNEALDFGARVLRFVVDNMPHLSVIVCMGREAWECVQRSCNLQADWASSRRDGTVVVADHFKVVATYHPAARISNERAVRPWRCVHQLLAA